MVKRTRKSIEAEQKFLSIVSAKNGVALTDYISSRDNVSIRCANDHIFEAAPKHVNSDGLWCHFCPNKAFIEAKAKFDKRLQENQGKLIDEYVDTKTPITLECHFGHQFKKMPKIIIHSAFFCDECDKINGITYKDRIMDTITMRKGVLINSYKHEKNYKLEIRCDEDHIFKVKPNNLKKGTWCDKCSIYNSEKFEAKFINKIKDKNGILLSKYFNSEIQVDLQCMNGHQWSTSPKHIVNDDSWCGDCPTSAEIEAERRLREVIKNKHGTLLTEYNGIHNEITIECEFGHSFDVEANSITSMNSWCSRCSGNSPEQAAEEFIKIVEQNKGQVLGTYINSNTPVSVKCEKNHIFPGIPTSIKAGRTWCTICSESKGERMTNSFLKNIK